MKILLDTHFILWSLMDTGKLTIKEKDIISDYNNDVYISVISLWEISLKYAIKKLDFDQFNITELIDVIESTGIEIIGLDKKEAISYYLIPKIGHKDPFDRMLIWQAISRNIYLMSRDNSLMEYQALGLKLIK